MKRIKKLVYETQVCTIITMKLVYHSYFKFFLEQLQNLKYEVFCEKDKQLKISKYQIPETDSSFDPSKVCSKFSIKIENVSKNILYL